MLVHAGPTEENLRLGAHIIPQDTEVGIPLASLIASAARGLRHMAAEGVTAAHPSDEKDVIVKEELRRLQLIAGAGAEVLALRLALAGYADGGGVDMNLSVASPSTAARNQQVVWMRLDP